MKTRAWKHNAATAARHRRAAKAAHRRNRGNWSGYDGQQKHNAMKTAFKALIPDFDNPRVLAPQMAAELPFLRVLKQWQSEPVEKRVIEFPVWQSHRKASGE